MKTLYRDDMNRFFAAVRLLFRDESSKLKGIGTNSATALA